VRGGSPRRRRTADARLSPPESRSGLAPVHLLPVEEAIGLLPRQEIVEISGIRSGIEMDLVTHDASKFFTMLLKRNGYVLEQLYSPLIVHTTPEHAELKDIALSCITRHRCHHYLGFAATQWAFVPEGIAAAHQTAALRLSRDSDRHPHHAYRKGGANLLTLNEEFRLPFIPELVQRKVCGKEKETLAASEGSFIRRHIGGSRRFSNRRAPSRICLWRRAPATG
jgi:hypothetical protein